MDSIRMSLLAESGDPYACSEIRKLTCDELLKLFFNVYNINAHIKKKFPDL